MLNGVFSKFMIRSANEPKANHSHMLDHNIQQLFRHDQGQTSFAGLLGVDEVCKPDLLGSGYIQVVC